MKHRLKLPAPSPLMLVGLLAAAPAFAQRPPVDPGPVDGPYNHEFYSDRSSSQSFNVEVMRGMALTPDGSKLFAINSYAGSLLRYDLNNPTYSTVTGDRIPNATWPTVKDPVAVAYHGGKVFVLGQGTHALASHEPARGRFLDVFTPIEDGSFSEPADMVVDHVSGQAYVSCMGSDSVFRIDISGPKMLQMNQWKTTADAANSDFLLKRPRFLNWTGTELYVAPFLSGNNTMTVVEVGSPFGLPSGQVLNGYDTSLFPSGLPDHDLVRITPPTGGAPASIEPVFRRAGTLLTAHGSPPGTSEYWMLGVDALNLSADTEPDLKGNFAKNVLAHRTPTSSLETLLTTEVIDLDQNAAGIYNKNFSVPFPYAMEFGGPAGLTAIASSTLSRISLRDSNGVEIHAIPPVGAPPQEWKVVRDLMYVGAAGQEQLWIYCQQTSEIVIWDIPGGTPSGSSAETFSLRSDPTPEDLIHGRGIFYDASRSRNSRLTCATCHPGGESDVLAWPLRDGLHDFKDPMMTQPLKGLRETYPFHWRGERNLEDFNGAFAALLGGLDVLGTPSEPVGGAVDELADFNSFIFSLRPAANPNATLNRKLRTSLNVPGIEDIQNANALPLVYPADPTIGRDGYLGGTCITCHMLPTGGVGSTDNDNQITDLANTGSNRHTETIQLTNFIQARNQPNVIVDLAQTQPNGIDKMARPLLGAGAIHTGGRAGFWAFIRSRFSLSFDGTSPGNRTANGTSFILSMDTGMAPAAHHAVLLEDANKVTARKEIRDVLMAQADEGWIDLVVQGTSSLGGLSADRSWLYNGDPANPRFVLDNGVTKRQLGYFTNAANAANRNVFFGVPKGTGARYGHDFDGDGLINGLEPGANAWVKDRDGDTYPDGYEYDNGGTEGDPGANPSNEIVRPELVQPLTLLMARASHAEFTFEANEDVIWTLTATDLTTTTPLSNPDIEASGTGFARAHTAHLHGLRFDTTYSVVLRLEDRAGNTKDHVLDNSGPTFTTVVDHGGSPIVAGKNAIVSSLLPANFGPAGGGYASDFVVTVGSTDTPDFVGAAGHWVLAQITRKDSATGAESPVLAGDLVVPAAHNWDAGAGVLKPMPIIWGGAPYPVAPYDVALPITAQVPGNLILLPATSASGEVTINVEVTNAGADEITFNVIAILPPGAAAIDPNFPRSDFGFWRMPLTPTEFRRVTVND